MAWWLLAACLDGGIVQQNVAGELLLGAPKVAVRKLDEDVELFRILAPVVVSVHVPENPK